MRFLLFILMKQNQDYKNEAFAALKGRWPQAVLAFLAYVVIALAFTLPYELKNLQLQQDPTNLYLTSGVVKWYFFLLLGGIFVLGPLVIGLANCYKTLLADGDERAAANEFKVGFGNYWHHVWGYVLTKIFVFLWTLLFIIPGIVKTLSYAMTNYILVDRPELSANEAINLSKDMMEGHRFDLLYLYLSFAGWFVLSLFTLGIGFLWLIPYVQTSQSSFYLDVKADYERRNGNGF